MTGLLCMRDWSEDRPYIIVKNNFSKETRRSWICNTTSAIVKF